LIGGTTLGLMTARNAVAALLAQPVPWREVVVMPPALFAIGFVCGSMAGWLRSLSDWFGWVGDGTIGAAVGALYFAACAICFDGDRSSGGEAFVGGVIGGAVGILFGYDWRREARLRGTPNDPSQQTGPPI